jgi:hypothetical protein
MGRRAVLILGMTLILASAGCAPVNQPTRPAAAQLEGVRRLAVVVHRGGDFTVIKERSGGAGVAVVGAPFGVLGVLVAGAVHSGVTAAKDRDHAAAVAPHVADLAPQQALVEALVRTLRSGGRFGEIQVLEQPPEGSDRSRFDGVLLVKLPAWGLTMVAREPDLLSGFVELEVKMSVTSATQTIWEESNTALGRGRHPLDAFRTDPALARQEIIATFETAGQRLAYELLYPRGDKR